MPATVVDLVTSTFESVLAVHVVFLAGYSYKAQHSSYAGVTLAGIARQVLLPCLIFSTFAASEAITAHRFLQYWPILLFAIVPHLLSFAASVLLVRYASCPRWLIESLTFNNVTSFPLLLLYAFFAISTDESGVLSHLKWRSMDTKAKILERAVTYIVLHAVVCEFARAFLSTLFAKLTADSSTLKVDTSDELGVAHSGRVEEDDDDDETDASEEQVLEPTESTPLIKASPTTTSQSEPPLWRLLLTQYTSILIATILGLLVGLIPALKRAVVGSNFDEPWFWQSFGTGFVLLGGAFAVVDMLSVGAATKLGQEKRLDTVVPPTLGLVLIMSFWRYVCLPAATFSMVYGLRKAPVHAFLYDPTFSFILAITPLSIPSLPSSFNPYRASVHLQTTLVSLLTPLGLALALAIAGRGISYETDFDLKKALKGAAGGGLAGALAMILQVLTLMPLRTMMNYQYRFGGSMVNSAKTLWRDGGFPRYYAGLPAALFQGPLSRFGDTAANSFIFALLESLTWPVLVKTIAASAAAATFRMTLTPIDTLKTTQQTQGGAAGLTLLRKRISEHGVASLWYGALATAAATFVGHYPWFGTYNWLSASLPPPHNILQKLARQAFIGFAASVVSDTVSNSLRVVKTYRQVHQRDVGYVQACKEIIETDGWRGLFARGLPTRLLTNGLQGLLFSILWKLFTDLINIK